MTTPLRSPLLSTLLAAAVLSAAACGSEFTPQSKLERPRVLGLIAEPPEAPFDAVVSVRAVVALPAQVAGIDWTLCPLYLGAEAQYACAIDEIPLASTGDFRTVVPVALLDAALQALPQAMEQYLEMLRQIVKQSDTCQRKVIADWDACTAAAGTSDPGCIRSATDGTLACLHRDGLEVAVRAVLHPRGGTSETSVKRLLLRDPAPGREPNANPAILTMRVGREGVADGGVIEADPGTLLTLTPLLATGSAQAYVATDGTPATEELFLSWFATAGDMKTIRTTPELIDNELDTPKADAWVDPITVYVLVRDDRLGQGVFTFTVYRRGTVPSDDAIESSEDAPGNNGGEP